MAISWKRVCELPNSRDVTIETARIHSRRNAIDTDTLERAFLFGAEMALRWAAGRENINPLDFLKQTSD